MGKHRQQRVEAQPPGKRDAGLAPQDRRAWLWPLVAFLIGSGLTFTAVRFAGRGRLAKTMAPPIDPTPATLEQLLALPPEQLAPVDLAAMNLLCARGLPGSEALDLRHCQATLDAWARRVKSETDRHLYRFRLNPQEFNHSEAYFRMLMLVTVLQQDQGVHYNPARINDPDFRSSRDLFLHGLIADANGGTCASMPVLYVAVGRRLGYPLKLVPAKAHLFARWEEGTAHWNLEATNQGLSCPEDAYYQTWPLKLTEGELAGGYYLQSLNPAGELATFMALRGDCLTAHNQLPEAQVAYAQAHRLAPQFLPYWVALAAAVGKEDPTPSLAAQQILRGQNRTGRGSDIEEVEAINRFNRALMETQMRPAMTPSQHGQQGSRTQREW